VFYNLLKEFQDNRKRAKRKGGMMDKKRVQRSGKDCIVKNPDYGELIIEMVHNIDNEKFLKQIYTIIMQYKRRTGI
jgi:hypothetical protein